jgi:hypothetical protein
MGADAFNLGESVSGPWDGVYIAVYATALDGAFYGYAKLFASEPEDVWLQRPLLKLGTKGFDEALDALHEAEGRAKRAAAELLEPHFEGLWRTLVAHATRQGVMVGSFEPRDTGTGV